MNIFDRPAETMPRARLEQLQLERLQALLVRLKRNVRRYRERLADARVDSLADVTKLPLTTPQELADSFPYGMLAFPLREVIRLYSTLGPDGQPLVIGHTRNDLAQWSRLVARQLVASGVTANDVIQISLGGGTDPGASGYVLGAELIEASVIAEDPFHIDLQLAMLQNYRPTVLVTTPANAQDLIRLMDQRRLDPQSLGLRNVLLTRPVPPAAREQIGAGLFAAVRCNFGLGEVLDPGLCVECAAGGLHIHEDHFLAECVENELVITSLTREAMPLLRYRTRVHAELSSAKCSCGRTSVLLQPGPRLDHRLRVNETPLYESQIADVLAQTEVASHPFTVEVAERHLVIRIRLSESLFSDAIWVLEKLRHDVAAEFRTRLGLEVELRFVPPRAWDLPGPR